VYLQTFIKKHLNKNKPGFIKYFSIIVTMFPLYSFLIHSFGVIVLLIFCVTTLLLLHRILPLTIVDIDFYLYDKLTRFSSCSYFVTALNCLLVNHPHSADFECL